MIIKSEFVAKTQFLDIKQVTMCMIYLFINVSSSFLILLIISKHDPEYKVGTLLIGLDQTRCRVKSMPMVSQYCRQYNYTE